MFNLKETLISIRYSTHEKALSWYKSVLPRHKLSKNMSLFHISFFARAKDWTHEAAILYRRALKAAKYVGVLPYDWNAGQQELKYSKSVIRFEIFVTQYLLYAMYEGFVIYRLIYLYFQEKASMKRMVELQYVIIGSFLPFIFHSCSIFNHESLLNFINRFLSYARCDIQRIDPDGRKPRSIGAYTRNFPLLATGIICVKMITFFKRPEAPHLLSSLLPDVTQSPTWELIPYALIHGYIWLNQWVTIVFYLTVFMTHISATSNALNRTRPSPQMSPERFYRATRKLEVLQGNYNALFRWVWWAKEIVLVTIVVFGICGSIWNEGPMSVRLLSVSLLGFVATLKLWKGLGGVFETSSQVHMEWRKRDGLRSLLLRKRMRSMRPIRVEVGSYYYVDRGMVLTLLSIISVNTFTLLLAA